MAPGDLFDVARLVPVSELTASDRSVLRRLCRICKRTSSNSARRALARSSSSRLRSRNRGCDARSLAQ